MDSQINAVVEDLCMKFNVTAEYLVPRIQAYKMAMCMFGIVAAMVFVIIIGIAFGTLIVKLSKEGSADDVVGSWIAAILCEVIPIIIVLTNAYSYIGWKYAPEVKAIKYIANLVRR